MKNENLVNRSVRVDAYDGDKEKFPELYDRYFPILFNCLRTRMSAAEAEDLIEWAFFKLLKQQEKIEDVRAFLFTIIKNKYRDQLRHRGVVKKADAHFKRVQEDMENYAMLWEMETTQQKLLADKINELSPMRRAVINLYYLKGYKDTRIAEMFGVEVQTVRNHKSDALEILRKTVDKDILFLLLLFSIIRQI